MDVEGVGVDDADGCGDEDRGGVTVPDEGLLPPGCLVLGSTVRAGVGVGVGVLAEGLFVGVDVTAVASSAGRLRYVALDCGSTLTREVNVLNPIIPTMITTTKTMPKAASRLYIILSFILSTTPPAKHDLPR